jgi:hypothetical protein
VALVVTAPSFLIVNHGAVEALTLWLPQLLTDSFAMKLAKPALDIGLYTKDLDAMLTFWQIRVGFKFDELLSMGQGIRQHRHRHWRIGSAETDGPDAARPLIRQ